MKIAWFTPFCTGSAIGRYSAAILDELTPDHEVVVFATGLDGGAASHRPHLPTERIDARTDFAALGRSLAAFDIVVYNLGNYAMFHGDILRAQRERPGVAILHDFATYGLFSTWRHEERADRAGWLTELEYAHGVEAREWGKRVLMGQALPTGTQEGALRYNMARSCVRGAVGVVVHGEWARQALANLIPAPVVAIDFPAFLTPRGSRPLSPRGDKVRFLTFGAANPNKAADLVAEAISGSELLRGRAEYTIAGGMNDSSYVAELRRVIRQCDLGDIVRLVAGPDDATLHRLIGEADVLVNLRYPHLGECSASLQEALFHGKPTIVWAHGYYDEFPADVVCKVESLPQLVGTMERLVASPEERRDRAERSTLYAFERFCTKKYCSRLVAFLEDCCHARPGCLLADRLAARLSEFYDGVAPAEIVARLANEVHLMSRSPSVPLPFGKVA